MKWNIRRGGMQIFVGVEEVWYGGESQVVLDFDKILDAFEQPMDRRQGGETHHKRFASGDWRHPEPADSDQTFCKLELP